MNYTSVTNCVWAAAGNSRIDCTVDFEGIGPVPFTADATDVEAHGREIFTRAAAGEFGPVGAYVAPPPVVPATISDRQFFQQLAVAGKITQPEALAAVKAGTLPALLQGIVDALPDAAQRFNAAMLLSGATQFQRHHPLVGAVAASQGMADADVDAFFVAAWQL